MLSMLYGAMFVIAVIYLIILLLYFRERVSVYYTLLCVAVIMLTFSYYQISKAQTLEAAIYANQATYMGGTLVNLFMVNCLASICNKKIKTWINIICVAWGSFIFGLAMTIGSSTIYYKSIDLVVGDGYSYIVKEYGSLHFLQPCYIIGMMLYGLTIVVSSICQKKKVSVISSVGAFLVMMVCVFVYMGERILHTKYECMPFAYIISLGVLLLLLKRIKLYDISSLSAETLGKGSEYGFVIFGSKGNFATGDVQARAWFPELNDLKIDYVVEDYNTDFLQQIKLWLEKQDVDTVTIYERDGRFIEAKHFLLYEKKNKDIHCIRLRDDTQEQSYLKLMENYNETLTHDVEKKTERLREVQDDIIISMASIVENRDNNTGGHIKRTSDVVRVFAQNLLDDKTFPEMTRDLAVHITKAAPLHDFGKIAIPDVILNKPGKFTDEEYNEMKKHSYKGAVIVERILQNSEDEEFRKIAVNVAHYHHEKWDGKGYPDGLSGTKIPFEARVMALADVFDALVSKRVYKEQFDYDKAFGIIKDSCGTHFDPVLCVKFLECRKQLEELYDSYED